MKNIEKKKKSFWKSKLFLFAILPLFVVMATAGALTYYAVFSATITFTQPIVTSEDLTSDVNFDVVEFTALGEPITISNIGNTERTVVILHNNINPYVEVSYVGELTLKQKDLVTWVPNGDTKTITYTLVGDTFEFSGVPDTYSLIYYKDSDGYVYTGNVVEVIDMNLPVADDENAVNDNVLDYCQNGFNSDATQCVGAKLWLVPTNSITSGVINWGRASEFYFETELIQFNKEGNLVISPESSITFTPKFTVDEHSPTITDLVVETTIA